MSDRPLDISIHSSLMILTHLGSYSLPRVFLLHLLSLLLLAIYIFLPTAIPYQCVLKHKRKETVP